MKTTTKLWKDLYKDFSAIDFEHPTSNDVVVHTMRPENYAVQAGVIASQLRIGDSVLEIGCGYGGLAKAILDRIRVDYTVVDIMPMLAQAKRYLGDRVNYVSASRITTLRGKEFSLFISNFCLSETPNEYRTYIMEKIILNCERVSITDLNDCVKPTNKMVKDGYDVGVWGVENHLRKYFVIEKVKTRFNQSRYTGSKKK